ARPVRRTKAMSTFSLPAARQAWLALFYVLVASQIGHIAEHIAQMVQIHLLGLSGPNARGIVGTFDVEWVHFAWNAWILGAVLLLLTHYRGNSWLWVTAILAGWHGVEHAYLLATYLSTGVAGTAGLLASGGAIAGGLPIGRP